jgi:hypothetical protein
MKGEQWFWIAGIVKNDCFTLLTTAPGEEARLKSKLYVGMVKRCKCWG